MALAKNNWPEGHLKNRFLEPSCGSMDVPASRFMSTEKKNDLCLELNENPSTIFYKDEGGKSNYLTASCNVKSSNATQTVPIGNLKISPRLVYESGGEIEDEDEIFNVLTVDPKTVTSTNETFTVRFRIEKVSRRKDGKKFRIRFDYNNQTSQLLDYVSTDTIKSVQTSAVTVLSKRKSHTLPGGLQPSSSSFSSNHQNDFRPPHSNPKRQCGNDSRTSKKKSLKGEGKVEEALREKLHSMELETDTSSTSVPKQRKKDKAKADQAEMIAIPVDLLMRIKSNMLFLEEQVGALTERVAQLEKQKPANNNFPTATRPSRLSRPQSILFEEGFADYGISIDRNNSSVSIASSPPRTGNGIPRNGNSTQELFEFLSSSQVLN